MHEDKPSNTARLVANWLHFQLHEKNTYHLGSDQWREWSARFLQASGFRGRASEYFASAGFSHKLYQQVVPGFYKSFSTHLLFRKLWVERATRTFLADAIQGSAQSRHAPRVVVVGAGLDTLCFRLAPEYPQAQFIEVDHPATQGLKRKALHQLEQGGCAALSESLHPENLHLVSADLRRLPLSEALAAQGYVVGSDSPTFVILEGLFMYLNRDIVQSLMHDLTHVCRAPQVAFTFLAPWRYAMLRQLVVNMSMTWLKLWREPFEWIVQPDDLKALLSEWGWSVEALRYTCDVAQEDFGFAFSEAVSEQLCLARFGETAVAAA